jgi:hypothetical protein
MLSTNEKRAKNVIKNKFKLIIIANNRIREEKKRKELINRTFVN